MSVAVDQAALEPGEPERSAPGWRSAWPGTLTLIVCALTPVVGYLGNLGFAPLVALAGLGCLPLALRDRRPNLGLIALLLLTAWALVSTLWSVGDPPHPDFRSYKAIEQFTAIKLAPQFALYSAFVVGAFGVSGRAGGRATLVLGVGLLAVGAVFLFDGAFGAPVYNGLRRLGGHPAQRADVALRDLSRTAYVLALFFWPAALRLDQAGWRIVAGALALATVGGAVFLGSDAPIAALIVSTAVFLAVRFAGRPALLAMLAGVVVYFLAAPALIALLDHPGLLNSATPNRFQSWAIRLDIWRFAADRIAERPFFGWGLDASRTFSPSIPLHTHDAALQIWLELGVVGAAIVCLFWTWLILQLDRLEARDRPLAAACAAAASAYLTIGAMSFGVWQEWWLALGALTAVVCTALDAARRGRIGAQAATTQPAPP